MDRKHKELLDRLGDEDSFVELKPRNPKDREVWETIIAFANSVPEGRSGVLFVGVSNKGEVLGIEDPDSAARKYGNGAARYCYPGLDPAPHYHSVALEDKKILVIEVSRSDRRPHFLGPAFVRQGSQNVRASDALFRDMLTAYCGKAGTILKLKDEIVTVEHIGCQLGRYEELAPKYHASPECLIKECTPHDVRFEYNHTAYSVPLEYVTLAGDPKRNRQWKIIVRHPRA